MTHTSIQDNFMGTTLTATKERPILFSGAMVRAILEGRKTQTRRVCQDQPDDCWWPVGPRSLMREGRTTAERDRFEFDACPYGEVGDKLWVRETFYAFGYWEKRFNPKKLRDEWHFVDRTLEREYSYRYDVNQEGQRVISRERDQVVPGWYKRPALFMQRNASRLALKVTGVRVERVQDISDLDAIAEGIQFVTHEPIVENGRDMLSPSDEFSVLWDSINAKRGYGWDVNPWVWVVEFKRL